MNNLLSLLESVDLAASISLREWDAIIPAARSEGLLAKLAARFEQAELLNALPVTVRDHLKADSVLAEDHRRMLLWEANRLERALRSVGCELILLKGAAYAAADLPPAAGRFVSDIDLLVRFRALPFVEATLMAHGWERVVTDTYDQRYYREWMHELPPLKHRDRLTIVDVHHAVLPRTSRLYFDPAPLWDAAVDSPIPGFKILAPADMVLHSAVHLFHDGDLDHGLRDLVDLHELLIHFGWDDTFWPALLSRATELRLGRPLFYVIRYCRKLLGTPIPEFMFTTLEDAGPSPLLRLVMDRLLLQRLAPREPHPGALLSALFAWCLYVRSHYLRMPLRLLLPHLFRKAWRPLQTRPQGTE